MGQKRVENYFYCCLVLLALFGMSSIPKSEGAKLKDLIEEDSPEIEQLVSSLSQSDLDRIFLLKKAVESSLNSNEIQNLPIVLNRYALLKGLSRTIRNELGVVYSGQKEVNYATFFDSTRVKIMEPCKQIDAKLNSWWSNEAHGEPSRVSIEWLAIENICRNVISIMEETEQQEGMRKAYRIFRDELNYEIDRLRLGGLQMSAGLSRTWLVDSLGMQLNWLVFLKKCIEQASPPKRDIGELRVRKLPRELMVAGLATFMKVELGSSNHHQQAGSSSASSSSSSAGAMMLPGEEAIERAYSEKIRAPCELVDRALSNWWWECSTAMEVNDDEDGQSSRMQPPLHPDEIGWLTIQNICQNLLGTETEKEGLTSEVYAQLKQQLSSESALTNYELRERQMFQLEAAEFSFWS